VFPPKKHKLFLHSWTSHLNESTKQLKTQNSCQWVGVSSETPWLIGYEIIEQIGVKTYKKIKLIYICHRFERSRGNP